MGNIDYVSHVDQEGYEDWWQGAELQPEEGYLTELVTDHGIDFIKSHKDSSFFLYLPHGAPHYPYQGPEDEAERAIGGDFKVNGKREDIDLAYQEMIESLDKNVGSGCANFRRRRTFRQHSHCFLFRQRCYPKSGF